MFNIRIDPDMPDHMVRIEQDGRTVGAIINLESKPLSIEALTANLNYAEAQRQAAYDAHKQAIFNYYLALDALNQAICKKNNSEG
jgi:hypothetical protein